MKHIKTFICIAFLVLVGTTACVSKTLIVNDSIEHKWLLEQVVDEEGSVNQVEPGNFGVIKHDTVMEVINKSGNRLYPYFRKANILHVTSGQTLIKWEIIYLDANNLHLKTPIGTYFLKR